MWDAYTIAYDMCAQYLLALAVGGCRRMSVSVHLACRSFEDVCMCKAYILILKADRKMDWEDKAMVGYFIWYSKKARCRVIMGDVVVTSVHVLLDEAIPEKFVDYFRELDEATMAEDMLTCRSTKGYFST